MRNSSDTQILKNDKGEFFGFKLHPDFVAEHEWGIANLQLSLGINPDKLGINGRKITNPYWVRVADGNQALYLFVYENFGLHKNVGEWFDKQEALYTKHPDKLNSAWDGSSFYIAAKTEEEKKFLVELSEHADKKDMAVWLSGGLVIAIKSKLDKDLVKQMMEVDKKSKALKKEDKKLNLYDKIREKSPYAGVQARWTSEFIGSVEYNNTTIDQRTKYKILYWLNMSSVYGYFTVEEIKEWLEKDTGHIADKIKHRK